ncbi:intracellular protein transport protein USO1-like isoform X2 [Mauremys mutica]|uniref:intracellular protein transport protein USO1-like isoform X2 n=1 Tax=Mauremys mutica TaxID=74926 RepID=UPI001D16320D|nr:intracellular protein transport protein USO1-like isoform X2 [Mauremys mutica]
MISGTSPAASEETDYCWDIWIAAEGDSVFQSQHINMLLKEQLQSLCKEGNNIKTSIGDVEKAMSSMEAELSRIKQAETMKTLLEAEIQTAKKTLEEEQESASQKELYLRKLEKDNEDLHLRLLMLSEENSSLTVSRRASQRSHMQLWADVHKLGKKLQECKLASGVEDEIFRKMKHQARELEESIKEYEAVIQVLQNKEKSLQDQLSAAEEKARTLPRTPSNILSINPKSLMFEIVKAELAEPQVDSGSAVAAHWCAAGHPSGCHPRHSLCPLHLLLRSHSDRGLSPTTMAVSGLLPLALYEAAQFWHVTQVIPGLCRSY